MSKQEKELIKGLESTNPEVEKKSIEGLRQHGTVNSIEPLFKLWLKSDDEVVGELLFKIFCDIRITDAPAKIIELLCSGDYDSIMPLILNTMWNSGLDYTPYMPEITRFALKGDFNVALEALTLIENMEGEFSEELTMESLLAIKDFENNGKDADEQKVQLLAALKTHIHTIDGTL